MNDTYLDVVDTAILVVIVAWMIMERCGVYFRKVT